MQIMKSGKIQIMEEIELFNQERVRTLGEKKNYKYLGNLIREDLGMENIQ